MRKNRVKKAFTLIEIVIVLIVISILIRVLFQVYSAIAQVAVRIRLEKQVWIKVVHMQTLMQNIIDTNRVDYTQLKTNNWWTTTLPLIHTDQKTGSLSINSSWRLIYTTMSWETEQVTSLLGDEIVLTGASFVVTPLTDPNASSDPNIQWDIDARKKAFLAIQQPWVWMLGRLTPIIEPKIQFPIQTFYTFIQK